MTIGSCLLIITGGQLGFYSWIFIFLVLVETIHINIQRSNKNTEFLCDVYSLHVLGSDAINFSNQSSLRE